MLFINRSMAYPGAHGGAKYRTLKVRNDQSMSKYRQRDFKSSTNTARRVGDTQERAMHRGGAPRTGITLFAKEAITPLTYLRSG